MHVDHHTFSLPALPRCTPPPKHPTLCFVSFCFLFFLSSPICVSLILLGIWNLPWSVGDLPAVTLLKKTDSSFPSCQMSAAPSARSGTSHSLLLLRAGILSGLSLTRSCAFCHIAVNSYVQLPCCLENTVSLCSSTTSGSCSLSTPSFTKIPEP